MNGNKDISKVKPKRLLTVSVVLTDKVSRGNYSKNSYIEISPVPILISTEKSFLNNRPPLTEHLQPSTAGWGTK